MLNTLKRLKDTVLLKKKKKNAECCQIKHKQDNFKTEEQITEI